MHEYFDFLVKNSSEIFAESEILLNFADADLQAEASVRGHAGGVL